MSHCYKTLTQIRNHVLGDPCLFVRITYHVEPTWFLSITASLYFRVLAESYSVLGILNNRQGLSHQLWPVLFLGPYSHHSDTSSSLWTYSDIILTNLLTHFPTALQLAGIITTRLYQCDALSFGKFLQPSC